MRVRRKSMLIWRLMYRAARAMLKVRLRHPPAAPRGLPAQRRQNRAKRRGLR